MDKTTETQDANEIDSKKEIGYNINRNLGAMHRTSERTGGRLWKTILFEEVYFKDIIERYRIGLPEVLGELTDDFLNCFI